MEDYQQLAAPGFSLFLVMSNLPTDLAHHRTGHLDALARSHGVLVDLKSPLPFILLGSTKVN